MSTALRIHEPRKERDNPGRASDALRTLWLLEGPELRRGVEFLLSVDVEDVLEREAQRWQPGDVGRGGHYMVHSARQREGAFLAASHSQTAAQNTPSAPAWRINALLGDQMYDPGAQNWL